MKDQLDNYLPDVSMNSEPSKEEFDAFTGNVGDIPHEDYLRFMKAHDGGEGPVGAKSFVAIWPLKEVMIASDQAGVPKWAPGLLLFAGDGGDKAYAFDKHNAKWPIVSVSLTSMSRDEMELVAETFSEFIRRLSSDELW